MHKIVCKNNKMEQVNIFKQTKQVNRKVQLKNFYLKVKFNVIKFTF